MTFDRDTAPLKTYLVWSTTSIPGEHIEASSSFIARKTFAAKHKLQVTSCMARSIEPTPGFSKWLGDNPTAASLLTEIKKPR